MPAWPGAKSVIEKGDLVICVGRGQSGSEIGRGRAAGSRVGFYLLADTEIHVVP